MSALVVVVVSVALVTAGCGIESPSRDDPMAKATQVKAGPRRAAACVGPRRRRRCLARVVDVLLEDRVGGLRRDAVRRAAAARRNRALPSRLQPQNRCRLCSTGPRITSVTLVAIPCGGGDASYVVCFRSRPALRARSPLHRHFSPSQRRFRLPKERGYWCSARSSSKAGKRGCVHGLPSQIRHSVRSLARGDRPRPCIRAEPLGRRRRALERNPR
jgi:hypothetical protein